MREDLRALTAPFDYVGEQRRLPPLAAPMRPSLSVLVDGDPRHTDDEHLTATHPPTW